MPTRNAKKRNFLIANWKMNLEAEKASQLATALSLGLQTQARLGDPSAHPPSAPSDNNLSVVVCPSFLWLHAVGRASAHQFALGAQDCARHDSGAHTGEVSAAQLKSAGVEFVLLGHSERRRSGESATQIGEKLAQATRAGLSPVLCLGESADESQAGATQQVLGAQLRASLSVARAALSTKLTALLIAYEPIWAIGSGHTPTPDAIGTIHAFIRNQLEEWLGADAATIPVLYGGSLTEKNAESMALHPEIDGALVGGASLDAEQFLQIHQIFTQCKAQNA